MASEKYTTYAPETDMTFIMLDVYDGDELKSTECIGWYFGSPNEKDTSIFCGSHKAEF